MYEQLTPEALLRAMAARHWSGLPPLLRSPTPWEFLRLPEDQRPEVFVGRCRVEYTDLDRSYAVDRSGAVQLALLRDDEPVLVVSVSRHGHVSLRLISRRCRRREIEVLLQGVGLVAGAHSEVSPLLGLSGVEQLTSHSWAPAPISLEEGR